MNSRFIKTTTALTFLSLALFSAPATHADTFGSGLNTFDIEFVTIGNPGNADDTTGNPNPAGKVDYTFQMGQFEISEDMVNKANTLGGLGITHDNRGANKPATSISWFEAAQFVNWLNGSTPVYKFVGGNFQLWTAGDAGYDANNPYRNSLATYFLPSMDEWYKAAYYDPNKSGGAGYYDYPTGSDSVPAGIDFEGDTTFDAVFFNAASNPQPNDITDVGVLSPYGTAGQGGNVMEWEETDGDLVNDSSSSARGVRGGFWYSTPYTLRSSDRADYYVPSASSLALGFRVASIPEPSTLLLSALAGVGLLMRRGRSS